MKTARFTTGETEILRKWELAITPGMVMQRQGVNVRKVGERKPRLIALAERAIAMGKPLIKPQVAFRELRIQGKQAALIELEHGAELKGATVARKLSAAESAVAMVATAGGEIEREVGRISREEPALGLALDGYATAVVGALIVAFRRELAERVERHGLRLTTPLYPGTHGWELGAAQTELFSIVDAAAVGVALTESFVMNPCKSVSMVFGIGEEAQATENPCEECEVAATCKFRTYDN